MASCLKLVWKGSKTKLDIYGARLSNRLFRAKGKFDPDTVGHEDAERDFISEYFEANGHTPRVVRAPTEYWDHRL
jgi:hypothetical protein